MIIYMLCRNVSKAKLPHVLQYLGGCKYLQLSARWVRNLVIDSNCTWTELGPTHPFEPSGLHDTSQADILRKLDVKHMVVEPPCSSWKPWWGELDWLRLYIDRNIGEVQLQLNAISFTTANSPVVCNLVHGSLKPPWTLAKSLPWKTVKRPWKEGQWPWKERENRENLVSGI